jgi:hypothetical protein
MMLAAGASVHLRPLQLPALLTQSTPALTPASPPRRLQRFGRGVPTTLDSHPLGYEDERLPIPLTRRMDLIHIANDPARVTFLWHGDDKTTRVTMLGGLRQRRDGADCRAQAVATGRAASTLAARVRWRMCGRASSGAGCLL